ncbi:MAG: hypothetical protein ABJG78_12490 [Cyclobacteriaceae bacterium]
MKLALKTVVRNTTLRGLLLIFCAIFGHSGISQVSVDWIDLVGVTVTGDNLVRTAGGTGWGSAGAASASTLSAGTDGWVETTAQTTSTPRMVGLSTSNLDANYNTITYVVYLRHNARLHVYETGVHRGDLTNYQVGDVVKVERIGSTVTFLKNNVIFYTSSIPSTTDVLVDAAIHTGELSNVKMSSSFSVPGQPSFTVSKTTATTSETGTDDTFTVVLGSEPTSDVNFTIAESSMEGSVDKPTLTFTSANWSTAQTVTVQHADDAVADGDQSYDITVAVTDGTSANEYDPLPDQIVSVTNQDDDVAGFTVNESSLATSESGTTASFTMVLDSQPTGEVRLNLTENSDEGNLDQYFLTFNSANWNNAQTVVVQPIDDVIEDGDQLYDIGLSIDIALSADEYDAVPAQIITVTNQDDDGAGGLNQASGWVVNNGTIHPIEIPVKVGIGTQNVPDGYQLAVDGKAVMEEVSVQLSGNWPDYVFEFDYDLPTLESVEAYIKSEHHLPEIPSAKEMEENGVELGTMNMLLLKKIEELTLYAIKQETTIKNQQTTIEKLVTQLKTDNQKLMTKVEDLYQMMEPDKKK